MDPFKLEKANDQRLKRAKTKALKVENRRKIQPLLVKENKEKKSLINKHFYKENKDSILEKKFCNDCKKFITAVNFKKHTESKTHLSKQIRGDSKTQGPNEKHVCECGGLYTKKNLSQHIKSVKHWQFIHDREHEKKQREKERERKQQ